MRCRTALGPCRSDRDEARLRPTCSARLGPGSAGSSTIWGCSSTMSCPRCGPGSRTAAGRSQPGSRPRFGRGCWCSWTATRVPGRVRPRRSTATSAGPTAPAGLVGHSWATARGHRGRRRSVGPLPADCGRGVVGTGRSDQVTTRLEHGVVYSSGHWSVAVLAVCCSTVRVGPPREPARRGDLEPRRPRLGAQLTPRARREARRWWG
jgi:hypothetical protein